MASFGTPKMSKCRLKYLNCLEYKEKNLINPSWLREFQELEKKNINIDLKASTAI